jgi:hypothetical protein
MINSTKATMALGGDRARRAGPATRRRIYGEEFLVGEWARM